MKRWLILTSLFILAGCGTPTISDEVGLQYLVWGDIQTTAEAPVEQWHWPAITKDMVLVIQPYALWDQATCHGDWPSQISLAGTQWQAPYPPCDLLAYQFWLAQAVGHYQAVAVAWQVVGAPDQQISPTAEFIGSAKSYSQLVVTSAEAIHQADPTATVLLGAISSTKPSSLTFFSKVIANAKVISAVDAITVQLGVSADWSVIESLLKDQDVAKPVWVRRGIEIRPYDL